MPVPVTLSNCVLRAMTKGTMVTPWLVVRVEVNGCVLFPTRIEPAKVENAVIMKEPVVFPAIVKVLPDLSKTDESKDHDVW